MFKFLIILSFAILTIGCGSQVNTNGSTEFDSRLEVPDEEYAGLVATCNTLSSTKLELDALITPLYINGAYSQDEVLVYLKNLTSSVASGQIYLQFFKQFDNTNKVLETVTQAVEFSFVNRATLNEIGNTYSVVSAANIQAALTSSGYYTFYNTTNFFQYFAIKLKNVPLKYESLLIANYQNGQTQHLNYETALIPSFNASPNAYALNDKSQGLKQAHPMYSEMDNGMSEEQYKAAIEGKCNSF